ncbi:MAG: ChaN family lipoprotein [Myxococcota bacterium]
MQHAVRAVLLLALAWLSTGCASTGHGMRDHPTLDEAVAVSTAGGEPLDREAVLARLEQARHVYVAEEHGSPLHHRAQLEVLRLLHEAGVPVAVGVEWLPVDAQPVLDAWVAGELDEEAFVRDVEWKRRWGHPYHAYGPILRWARDEGVPVRALNAPKGLAHKVAADALDGLTPEEEAALPPLDSGNPEHRAFFDEMMEHVAEAHEGGDGHGGFDEETLARYYQAQLVWDEHMAREAARWLESAPSDEVLVVFAGGGHVRRGLGIPLRVRAATGLPLRIVLPVARDPDQWTPYVGDEPYPDREADFLWLGEGEEDPTS